MQRALKILETSEQKDGYEAMCSASPLNELARRNCIYQPWIEQPFLQGPDPAHTIVTMHPTADGGMPHTRAGNVICIPVYWPEAKLKETLHHEEVHLDQRENLGVWKEKLLKEGWAPVEENQIPKSLVNRTRINPDTSYSRFWAWEGRHVPLPLFVREDAPDLREIDVRWFDLQEGRVNPFAPFTFTAKYGKKSHSEMEHPFELYAYK